MAYLPMDIGPDDLRTYHPYSLDSIKLLPNKKSR